MSYYYKGKVKLISTVGGDGPHGPISSGGPRMYSELAELLPRIQVIPFSLNHYCCPPTPSVSWTFRRACYYIVFLLSYRKQMVIVLGLISIICRYVLVEYNSSQLQKEQKMFDHELPVKQRNCSNYILKIFAKKLAKSTKLHSKYFWVSA